MYQFWDLRPGVLNFLLSSFSNFSDDSMSCSFFKLTINMRLHQQLIHSTSFLFFFPFFFPNLFLKWRDLLCTHYCIITSVSFQRSLLHALRVLWFDANALLCKSSSKTPLQTFCPVKLGCLRKVFHDRMSKWQVHDTCQNCWVIIHFLFFLFCSLVIPPASQ